MTSCAMVRIMTISITRFSVLLLLGGNLVLPFAAYAEGSPHWSKSRCQDCHVEAAPVDGVVNLQEADAEALCEACHGSRGDAKACRHMSGIPAGDVQIAEGLTSSLENGEIVCTTCHDIVYQCKHARAD